MTHILIHIQKVIYSPIPSFLLGQNTFNNGSQGMDAFYKKESAHKVT